MSTRAERTDGAGRRAPTADAERSAEILSRALELSGDARNAYIEGACGGDAALRAEVLSLLAAHDGLGAFMAAPTANGPGGGGAGGPSSHPSEGPGTVIGRYKLLQEIGEGGFGVVYMAQQLEPVKRKVALKIIKLGMDTKQVIGRFEAERQALAMMDHPNIAKVLDAGATETGRPYFVMELVKGVPITEYCDTNGLAASDRLGLFTQVCSAVQHAHQKGIIHRDIKPSNVMVTLHDGTPVPKVIDFGIAKATNQELTQMTVFTEFRQFLGTPEYMSPEQAEMSGLDVDTRTDIYALGVLLYELLTGTTPFEPNTLRSAAYGEIQRIIREVEPPRPSTRVSTLGAQSATVARQRDTEPAALCRLIRGDLDWIVMKALEKDRTRRYETANGLALDVKRYLASEPVLAGPPRASYRLRKFVRRNRVAVGAGSLVAVALVGGVALATVGLVQARRSQAVAAAQAERAQLAEEKAKLLRRLFGGGTVSIAVLPLDNLSADPEQDYFADGVTETLIDDLAKISALHVIPSTSVMRYKGTGKPLGDIARELHADAILQGSVLRAGNNVQINAELVHAATDQRLWADRYQGGISGLPGLQNQLSRDIAAEIQLQLTPQDRSRLAAERPVAPEAHEAYLKGRYALRRGNAEGARTALEFFDEAIRIEPDYAAAHAGRADAYWNLVELYERPKDIMPQLRAAAMRAIELDPGLPDAYVALGRVQLYFDWDWEGAHESLGKALELNPRLASAHLGEAVYLMIRHRADEALAALNRALELDPLSLVIDDAFGQVPYNLRQYEKSVELCRRAIELDPTQFKPYAWLGLALAAQHKYGEAIEALETARDIDDSPIILEFLGGVYAMAGRDADARAMIEELDRQSEYRFICPYEVATIYIALGEYDEAFEWLFTAYEERSTCFPNLNSDPRLDPIRDDPRFEELQQLTGHEVGYRPDR